MIHVLIVEDSRIYRDTFVRQLSATPEFTVTDAITNAANAEIACMYSQIDLVLMDICTADDESGLTACARIKKHHPDIKIILMTSMPEFSFLEKAEKCGCDSFWYKEDDQFSLLEICSRTMNGDFILPDHTPEIRIGLARSSEFTARELDIMKALAGGLRYEEIASSLYLSVNTVKYHVKNILQKTGFRNILSLVVEVVEKKYILPKY